MKKPKIKFDKDQIKSFFALHGEKLGFGLFGLVFLWFVYAALTLESYERAPDELEQAVGRANQHVERQTFDAKTEGFVFVDPAELVAFSSERLEPDLYRLEPFNPRLWPASKRTEPEFLAVNDLEVTSGFGTFRLDGKAEGSRGGFKAYRWACITGLIPYEQQIQAYQQALGREAPDPQYVFPFVQRAEVTAGSDAELKWETLNFSAAMADHNTWKSQATKDTMDNAYLVPEPKPALPMAFPLGPLVGRDWKQSEVVHSQILELVQAAAAAKEKPAEKPQEANETLDPEAMFREQEEKGTRPTTAQNTRPGEKPAAKFQPLRLFRYFDFTVEPGKRYRYRVALNLRNPNAGVAPHQLEDPKFAEGTYRRTAISAASPPVSIPFDSQIVFGSIVPARGMNEIAVKAIVAQRDSEGRLALAELTPRHAGQLRSRGSPPGRAWRQCCEPSQPTPFSHRYSDRRHSPRHGQSIDRANHVFHARWPVGRAHARKRCRPVQQLSAASQGTNSRPPGGTRRARYAHSATWQRLALFSHQPRQRCTCQPWRW